MENEIFEKAPVPKAFFTMALPVVFSMVISLVYNMVDTYFIARTGNTNLVAGVSLGAPIFTLMIALGDIFGLGGSSVISRLFGEKRRGRKTAQRLLFLWCDPANFYIHKDELIQIFAIGIPASITNLMQSLGMTLMNRSLLPHGNDRVAAMGIIMKVNMIAVLILVGFAFGGQPLIGYNYGAKNRRRLKEILSFAYKFECGLGLLLTILLSLAARPMIRIFMKDNTIVSLGVPMLRMQLLGMVFVAIVLVTTCTFQSAGMARNAFLLSISRQGVIFAIVLAIASHTIGYQGILLSQAISDLLTAVLAIALYRTSVAKELHT